MAKVEIVMDEKMLLARHTLNLKLVKSAWALFFILVGTSWILENIHRIANPWPIIYAGSGAILLFLNLLRIIWRINISKFTILLGALGFIFGLGGYYKLNFSILAAAVLIIGIFMLFDVLRK